MMKPSREEHAAFWQIMAEACNAGKSVLEALCEAREQSSNKALQKIAGSLIEKLQSGQSLSEALGSFPDFFEAWLVGAVAASEESGTMCATERQIADALKANVKLSDLAEPGTRGPTIEYVNQLLQEAVKARASDIHLDPAAGDTGHVRLRIDGVLREASPPPEGVQHAGVVNRIKVMASMDIAERRLPQDGRIKLVVDGAPIDLRVSVVPAYYGERVVLRILVREQLKLGLSELGLGEGDLEKVRQLCHLPNGIVIVTGPTGSGKTTLLYSMLMEVNCQDSCVLTVEDPVEYTFDGIGQVQIRPQLGLTFARAIRSLLRQDPDVIMVGELRDLETMELSVQVALTGHLLLTTLHTNTAVGAIQRLIDCGVEPFLVNSTLSGVISQRLVRMLCPDCKVPVRPPPAHSMRPEAVEFLAARKDAEFCGPKGCRQCRGTGYRGRTAIHEILIPDGRIRQLVGDRADMAAVRDAAREAGMQTIVHNGLEKAAQGITSIDEVLRVAPRVTN